MFWNIMPPFSALPPDYVVFIQDYHKLEYMLLRGYYNIVSFFSYFCIDQAFYESGSEITVLSFLKMYFPSQCG
jgi:hypothetical protein